MVRKAAGEAAFFIFVIVVGLGAYSMLSHLASDIPAIDSAFRRTIQFGYVDHKTGRYEPPIQALYRDEDRACWTVYLEKLREADIVSWDFYMDGGSTSAPIPTASYVVLDDGTPDPKPMVAHPIGTQWHRRYCAEIADRVPPFKSLTITGTARHNQWPHLWVTSMPIPTFTIAAIAKP